MLAPFLTTFFRRLAQRLSVTSCALLAVTLLFQPAHADVTNPSDGHPIKLACIGDSITAGYALKHPARDSYPAQLARLLGAGWEVRNFGVSGATLMQAGNKPYERQKLHDAAIAWQPDIAVVVLGTNDTKTVNLAAHPDNFIPSYRALIRELRTANPHVKIVLALPPPAFPAGMGISDTILTLQILPRIGAVAQEEHLPVVDLHTALQDQRDHFPDRIHPDAEAAAALARLVEAAVLPLVATSGAAESTRAKPTAERFPVLRRNATVLFVGDSITDGGRARTGNDYNHTMGQSYAFVIAARLGDELAERNLTFLNRGISGNTVADLQQRWQADVLGSKPEVITILVGINDTLWPRGESLARFETGYDHLLQETIAALPSVTIILGEPFILPVGRQEANYAATRAEVQKRQQVIARLAAKYHLPLIRYQDIFDQATERAPADHWSWDGVHPHYAGHGLMADAWIRTIAELQPMR